jgi:hypothetical protein
MNKLEKEFIPYEQALELKELGFNKPCLGCYYTLNGKDWEFGENESYNLLDEIYNIGPKFTLIAPLYQQAINFFREKYNLASHIATYWQHDWNNYSYQYYFVENQIEWNGIEHYKTYEEAELACLNKLIEICKNEQ